MSLNKTKIDWTDFTSLNEVSGIVTGVYSCP